MPFVYNTKLIHILQNAIFRALLCSVRAFAVVQKENGVTAARRLRVTPLWCVAYGISRVLCRTEVRCLSFIYDCSCLQPLATYPSTSDEQPYMRRYTWSCTSWDVQPESVATSAVGSYPTFSPLPSLAGRRLFSVTLCHALSNIFPLESTMLCGARTFLLSVEPTGDKPRLLQCGGKGNTFFAIYQKTPLYHSVARL